MAYTISLAAQWPESLEVERSLKWSPDWGHEASPPTIAGNRQFRSITGGGLWRALFSSLVVTQHRGNVRDWLALEIALRGGMTPVDVPLLLCAYQPEPATPTSDDAPVISSSGGWAARAVSGRIDLENAVEVVAGMHFSDYDPTTYGWRLHRIETVALAGSGGGPTERDITFWPPARFSVADGHRLEWKEPRCVMQLASADAMDIELDLRKRGSPSASFIEVF